MRKLYAAILSAAICLAVSGAPAWASEQQATLSAGIFMPGRTLPVAIILTGLT
ncbi:Ail/Lom family outer membrane beta-barrel protein [Escherichia coli]|nr:Ail/Lom family outer membrane beta-barrel protein [Escherichia coli]MCW3371872.1 Ail/Lom family outer membrane beta-barrel protein [Escherichia coli]